MKINRKRKLKILFVIILLVTLLNSCFPYYYGHSRYHRCYPMSHHSLRR